ncbi:MAG: ABC transporter permease, partial [Gemmatimonadaceae bacterium]
MSLGPGIRRLLRMPGRGASIQREVDDEMRFHLTSRVEALIASGHSPAQAQELAFREFGDVADARRDLTRIDRGRVRRRRVSGWFDALRGDLVYALRGLRRSPGFAFTVIATLAVGIGVNAAMFGIVDKLLLRPAPHLVNAETLRSLYYRVTFKSMGTFTGDSRGYPDYLDLARDGHSFAAVAAYYPTSLSVGKGASAAQVNGMLTTASFFPLLGVHPHVGRFFGAGEDQPHAGVPVAVLSFGYWQRAYGGASDVLGRDIELKGTRFTIVGIAPRGFRGIGTEPVDVFVPMSALGARMTSPEWATTYDWQWLRIVARLRPSASPERAAQEATAIFRRAHENNESEKTGTAVLASVIPGRGPNEETNSRLALLLSAVAAIVLLIAAANVANLLVSRAVRRQREIAVRTALGVSRARLVSQLLTESTLLAVLGGGGALLIAWFGGALLRRLLLPDFAPDDPLVDGRVFAVASMVALGCGLFTGLAPMLGSHRIDLVAALKSGAREGGYRRSRLRTTLLVVQAALSVTLLIGAALFVRSLSNALSVDLGYDARHTLVASQDLSSAGYDRARSVEFMRQARVKLSAIPGIAEASVSVTVPFMSSWSTEFRIAGIDSLPRLPDGGPYINGVSSNYFSTMGMRI